MNKARNPMPVVNVLENLLLDKKVRFDPRDLLNRETREWKEKLKNIEASNQPTAEGTVRKVELDYGQDSMVTLTMFDGSCAQLPLYAKIEVLE